GLAHLVELGPRADAGAAHPIGERRVLRKVVEEFLAELNGLLFVRDVGRDFEVDLDHPAFLAGEDSTRPHYAATVLTAHAAPLSCVAGHSAPSAALTGALQQVSPVHRPELARGHAL